MMALVGWVLTKWLRTSPRLFPISCKILHNAEADSIWTAMIAGQVKLFFAKGLRLPKSFSQPGHRVHSRRVCRNLFIHCIRVIVRADQGVVARYVPRLVQE